MVNVATLLNAYKEANNATRASMAREIDIAERRLRGIMTEGKNPTDLEEFIIREWLKKEGFDYVPPKVDETTEKPAQPKASAKGKSKAEAIGIRGDARVLVQMYREAMGFKTDTDAATHIVKEYITNLLREAK